ncbi:hypothetical protein FJ941_02490 [Mesorhizobium sp. B2-3-13]|uniref:hypothetical protein n=1 Tax=Mesorhizobium sp. B2-3-13 TaxID=2589951 RepID=UPI001126FC9C|nr:hypothetical protein [Mesorhizobium sp. B2-3-13]TPL89704.1 hypothetical protein FJ941_02490 [Mesorhizobium sp. B2-3-13]
MTNAYFACFLRISGPLRGAFVILAYCIAITLLLAPGPQLQIFLMGILNGDSASIYEAAHGTDVVPFVSLAEWLMEAYQPNLLAIAFVMAAATLRTGSPAQMLWRGTAAGLCALSINDFAIYQWSGTFEQSSFTESLFANLCGAFLISCAIVSITQIAEWTIEHLQPSRPLRRAAVALEICALGIFLNAVAFYAADFFYRPLPVQIDAYLDAPLNGSFATNPSYIDKDNPPFQLFPTDFDVPVVKWRNPNGGISAAWHVTNPQTKFDLQIEILSGCLDTDWISGIGADRPSHRVSDIKRLSVSFEGGASDFWIFDTDKGAGKISLEADPVAPFGLEVGKKANTKDLWQFIGSPSHLIYENSADVLSFYAGRVFLDALDDKANTIDLIPRKLVVEIDGKPYFITFIPATPMPGDKAACTIAAARKAFQSGTFKMPSSGISVGVRVTVTARPNGLLSRQDSELNVSGESGWITMDDIDRRAMDGIPGGVATLLEAKGNLSIDVDGTAQNVRPTDQFRAIGAFRGISTDHGKLRFVGNATSLTKNERRLNPTKFESGKITQQLTVLLPLLFFFLSVLIIPLRAAFKTDRAFDQVIDLMRQ